MKWRSRTILVDNSVRECFEKINLLNPKFLVDEVVDTIFYETDINIKSAIQKII